jgi:hypothetical protein
MSRFALLLLLSSLAIAQDPRTGLVCPLSESQTQKSIDAFDKVAAAFTQQDRCANCHGGVNPFTQDGHHAGGAQEQSASKRKDCQECHSGLPGWDIPVPEMFFMDGYHQPRKPSQICKQMKAAFTRGQDFVRHVSTNTDVADFNGTAFLGTRGLNDFGKMFVFSEPYRPEPPTMSRGEMTDRAHGWVDAMGGEFKGDVDCGCEPVHYAVRVTDNMIANVSGVHASSLMGPVDIPITFQDDGSFEGQQEVFWYGNDSAYVCSGDFTSAMTLRVSGKAIEESKNHHLHLQLENLTPLHGIANAHCPVKSVSAPFSGGSKGSLSKEFEGRVGDKLIYIPPGIPGGISVVFSAEIVKRTP